MNYEETMSYIKNTAKFGSKYGLNRTEKILELLDNPHKKLKCIHVAGTNGKGSTSAMITKVLLLSGYKVGMYTSPYLEEFEERIQIDNIDIPKDKLCEVTEKVAKAVDKVIELGYDHPTEFEIITCVMFLYFYEEAVDYAVIEVGLGGRLDSTNVITPIISIITSISYDHMNILGNTLTEIASEKGGIIKENIPTILYPQEEEAMKALLKICDERHSRVINVKKESVKLIEINDFKQRVEVITNQDSYDIYLSLLGKHQMLNCAVVVCAIEVLMELGLKIHKDILLRALSEVQWKGRMEIMRKSPLVLIDGAHNLDAINRLRESIDTYFKYKNMHLIIGILGDKEVDKMLQSIVPMAKEVFALTPHSERAELNNLLKEKIIKINKSCQCFDEYGEAYVTALKNSSEDDIIVICGSLYMIGDMRKIIKNA